MTKTIEEAANSSDSVRRAVPRKERSAWRRIWEAYKADFKAARDAYEDEYSKIYHHPPVQLTGVIEATTVVTPVSVVDTSKEVKND